MIVQEVYQFNTHSQKCRLKRTVFNWTCSILIRQNFPKQKRWSAWEISSILIRTSVATRMRFQEISSILIQQVSTKGWLSDSSMLIQTGVAKQDDIPRKLTNTHSKEDGILKTFLNTNSRSCSKEHEIPGKLIDTHWNRCRRRTTFPGNSSIVSHIGVANGWRSRQTVQRCRKKGWHPQEIHQWSGQTNMAFQRGSWMLVQTIAYASQGHPAGAKIVWRCGDSFPSLENQGFRSSSQSKTWQMA